MKGLSALSDALLTGAESSEVLGSLRDRVSVELHDDSPGWLVANANIEENVRVWHSLINCDQLSDMSRDKLYGIFSFTG